MNSQDRTSNKFSFKRMMVLFFILSFPVYLFSQNRIIKEKVFEVNKGQMIKVEAEGADIKVDTWDKESVEVKVYGNRKAEDKLDIDFYEDSKGVEVVVERHGSFFSGWFSSIQCKIEVMVPAEFNAELRTSGGDVFLSDLTGKMEIKTSGGDVVTSSTTGQLNVKTSGGDIEVEDQNGESSLGTSGGDIKCKNSSGNMDVSTSGGDIVLDVKDGELDAVTSGGDVDVVYTGDNKGIELKTSGGDITLQVEKNLKGDVYLTASGGRVYCDLDATKVYRDSKRKYEAEINGGGEKVYCKTSGGDVKVK